MLKMFFGDLNIGGSIILKLTGKFLTGHHGTNRAKSPV
jgi:hypothetical protein